MIDLPDADSSRQLIEDMKAYIRKDLNDPRNKFIQTVKNGIRLSCTNLEYTYTVSVDMHAYYVKEMVVALNEMLADKGYEITFIEGNVRSLICFNWNKK